MVKKRYKNVKQLVRSYIKLLQKDIRVEKVVLFGSYARGTPRDYSDIDLAVVSPNFRGGTEKDHLILARAARQITPLIEALPYTPKDFNNYEPGDFIDQIHRTGKVIYPSRRS